MSKTAIIIGATGLVGNHLLKQLLEDDCYAKVKVFVRRSAEIHHPKLEEIITNFDLLEAVKKEINGDVLFSCLGTTLKQAGSKQTQYKIDFTYQYEFAKLAQQKGVVTYFLVSSTGANARSIFFYSKMKGELEHAVKELDFKRTVIIQPSVLLGDRQEERAGEKIGAKVINGLGKIIPPLKKYRGIHGSQVAAAMNRIYKNESNKKVEVFKLDELFEK